MSLNPGKLDFAYKYPFSNEAKEIVQGQVNEIDIKYLDMGGRHIENAMSGDMDYKSISIASIKLDYIMTYLYSRMLLSALKRTDLIKLYSIAEAKRSYKALSSNGDDMIDVALQLGIRLTNTFSKSKDRNGIDELALGFMDYVKYAPRLPNFELVNQKLSGGVVVLNRNSIAKVLEQAIMNEIAKSLPIKSTDLPKQVIEYAKGLRFRTIVKQDTGGQGKKTSDWIEKLLQTPIADVRHRTVNLILAPYLVNAKGFEVEQASKIIIDYIERCKQIDPSTKINDNYIKYQCAYAKKRGLRPLSLERAKELLGSQVDLELQVTEQKKV